MQERLLELIAELRTAGLSVSVAETVDAMRAVEAAGIERAVLREALAASLVKYEEDRAAFDAVFDVLFAIPAATARGRRRRRASSLLGGGESGSPGGGPATGAAGGGSAAGGESAAGPGPRDRPAPRPVEKAAPGGKGDQGSAGPADESARAAEKAARRADASRREPRDAGGAADREDPRKTPAESRAGSPARAEDARRHDVARAADLRAGARPGRGLALLTQPFRAMDPVAAEAVHELARELGRRLAARASRRERRLRRGRIDVRRTIRASLAHGGVPIDLERRGRRPGRPDLLVLCDVSASVATASELLLTLLATGESAFRRVHRFAFVDRPVEVAFADRLLMPAGELDLYARSDLGAVLRGLEAEHASLFDRATVVLVVGDARNNRKPPRADVLRRLAARSRALVWAVPEPRARWYTGDSALASYEPHCHFVCEATSLSGLLSSLREALRR